ncbi:MAG: hypothetical protein AB1566_14655 [Chloroflexota bacterium]
MRREVYLALALTALLACALPTLAPPTPTLTPVPAATNTPSQPAASPTPVLASEAIANAARLAALKTPPRDLYSLTGRLKLKSQEPIARVVNPQPPNYQIGHQDVFWVSDQDVKVYRQITATLRYITPHSYMYVENGVNVDLERLKTSAELFESRIYPTNRQNFGSEWTPGVDNDPHITILNARFSGAAGYYSSADEYPQVVNRYSNQREMFYMNVDGLVPGTTAYNSTLAHEFQHMIHWYQDQSEEGWINEGLSQLAEKINGFRGDGAVQYYLRNPDTQLNAWKDDPEKSLPHYGASFLFLDYLAEKYGGYALLRDIVAEKTHGPAGITAALARRGSNQTFDGVFEDWVIANYVNDAQVAGGRYGYADIRGKASLDLTHSQAPLTRSLQGHQHAARYQELRFPRGDVTIFFTGTTQVRLLDNQPHSGRHQWWGNRGDLMDTSLTKEFDLSGLSGATLTAWLWYDIERDFDYAYIEASSDGGATWETLRGRYTTDTNPNGNNLGHGYTGKSGGGEKPEWVQEFIDLSPYAGKRIRLRFECVTDDAYNAPGFAVDDVSIPELNYTDDAEADNGWESLGFLRSNNYVPQRFWVQVIKYGESVAVESVPLDGDQRGHLTVRGFGGQLKRAVLVVAPMAPVTTEPASYRYAIVPASSQ